MTHQPWAHPISGPSRQTRNIVGSNMTELKAEVSSTVGARGACDLRQGRIDRQLAEPRSWCKSPRDSASVQTCACSLTGCGVSYFVIVGPMARIRMDRTGRAVACEVIGSKKSLSLNFSRQGFQFSIRDRTSSGSEAYSCMEDYVQDSS